MARSACHEQENYILCSGRQRWLFRSKRVRRTRRKSRICQQVGQRHSAYADSTLLKEPAARALARVLVAMQVVLAIHGYSFVIVSSRFSMTRDTMVHAAASTGVAPSGRMGGCAGSFAATSQGFRLPSE